MANWQVGIQLSFPPGLEQIPGKITSVTNEVESALKKVESALETMETALDLFSSITSMVEDPIALAEEAIIRAMGEVVKELQGIIDQFIVSGGFNFVLTPFTPNLSLNGSLSFPQAIEAMAQGLAGVEKLRETFFDKKAELETIAIVTGASSLALLKERLATLNNLFGLKELRFAQRKIEQRLLLEKERMIRKVASQLPEIQPFQMQEIPQFRDVKQIMSNNLSLLEGAVKGKVSSIEGAGKFVEKKLKQLENLNLSLTTITSLFNSDKLTEGFYSMYQKAPDVQTLQQSLLNAADGASYDLGFCSCVLFVAPAPGLKSMKTILSL